LAIVQAIVDAHHGTIEVTSALGEGATFTIRLPVADTVPLPPTSPEQ
jgi:signal transduction histidine kinase